MVRSDYSVIWAPEAILDLKEIVNYIKSNHPQNAKSIYSKIKVAAKNLKKNPTKGPLVPELYELGIVTYRQITVTPWRVLYRVENIEVRVLLIVDGRRDLQDLLLRRLIRKT